MSKINSEMYCLKQSEDLYFVLTKVTPNNYYKWESLCDFQMTFRTKYYKEVENNLLFQKLREEHRPVVNHIGKGVAGFEAAIKYYKKCELWVAYASSELVTDPSEVDIKKIEMFITASTSLDNHFFTSHMGIIRSLPYLCSNKRIHKDLANQLHGFAAYQMQKIYSKAKYMITTPVGAMRNILVKGFEEKEISSELYICINNFTVKENLASLVKKEEELRPIYLKNIKENDKVSQAFLDGYNMACLKIALHKQTTMFQQTNAIPPIEFKSIDPKDEGNKVLIIKDDKGNTLLEINQEDQRKEFEWFFYNRCQSPDVNAYPDPLICCQLKALEKLILIKNEVKPTIIEETLIAANQQYASFNQQINDCYKYLKELELTLSKEKAFQDLQHAQYYPPLKKSNDEPENKIGY